MVECHEYSAQCVQHGYYKQGIHVLIRYKRIFKIFIVDIILYLLHKSINIEQYNMFYLGYFYLVPQALCKI